MSANTAIEILRQHLHVEIRARMLIGPDLIQCALKCQAIQ